MYDSYDYTAMSDAQAVAGIMTVISGVLLIMMIVIAVITVFSLICSWQIYKKAGYEGWKAIIPFYNLYIMYEFTWGNGWFFLLSLIPYVNFVIIIITMYKLAKCFGKGVGFFLGLIFLSPIFYAILAFGSSQYVGIDGKGNSDSSDEIVL